MIGRGRWKVIERLAPLALLLVLSNAAGPQPGVKKPVAKKPDLTTPAEPSNRHYVTLRGEIVDWYCYIEKGLLGPGHKDCGTRCVAGDVCMGLLTEEGELMMISVNHLRAMDPMSFRGIPDPFTTCRGLVTERVELGGYKMERKGQKIIEIMNVKKLPPGTPARTDAAASKSGDRPAKSL
jgi:hypothetical protein